jgi:O-antigen ligase
MLGAIILVTLKVSPVRRKIRVLIMPLIILALLFYFVFNMGQAGTSALGRDSTFTGRTEIWKRVLSENINPVIGVGFYSFWLGDRVDKVSEGFYYHLNESHNGYIETYLNSGWIGIFLLAALIISTAIRLRREIPRESDQEAMLAVFLAVMVVYNITEAAFNRMDVLWVCFLLACINYVVMSRQSVQRKDKQTVPAAAGQTISADYVNRFSRLQASYITD